MKKQWTFGQKVAAGFAIVVLLAMAIGITSIYMLNRVVTSKDRVITVDSQLLVDANKLYFERAQKGAAVRGYLLVRDDKYLEDLRDARSEFATVLGRLKKNAYSDDGKRILDTVERDANEHDRAIDAVIVLRKGATPLEDVVQAFDEDVGAKRKALEDGLQAFVSHEEQLLESARVASSEAASSAIMLVAIIAAGIVLIALIVATILTRTLGTQIGSAVGQVQSSSAELQAAANQQATGAKEQSTAMNEITTTISELLATSRQIAESAQRVAQIADQTAKAARAGDTTVEVAHESITAIKRQVDLIVNHMLELGKKSQQIGSVLDIVSELAEQTNILAINATIEAAGAGDAGKRFAVVADEIRKLADRVAVSTKEIRGLIDDVRGAVNTTVMATETGSKSVDAGSRQFAEVTAAFKQIGGLVGTTTDAAREIELSTKQQTTAVEQVNVAIANVAQATKETEMSSGQTLQTASQLALLSRDLLRLVDAKADT